MKILTLDIETAPHVAYSWGLFNQNISIDKIISPGYVLCWAAKWFGESQIHQSSLINDSENEMLGRVWRLLDEADAVVHYNGLKFDIPTLNRDFVRLTIQRPAPYIQIDLLATVKKHFRFASNKLDFVVQQLDIGRKPPNMTFDIWEGCMAGDPKHWDTMLKYNLQDVILTESLYHRLRPWIDTHPNFALYEPSVDQILCPHCGSHNMKKRGTYSTKTQRYQRYRCSDCGTWSRARSTSVPASERANILTEAR